MLIPNHVSSSSDTIYSHLCIACTPKYTYDEIYVCTSVCHNAVLFYFGQHLGNTRGRSRHTRVPRAGDNLSHKLSEYRILGSTASEIEGAKCTR